MTDQMLSELDTVSSLADTDLAYVAIDISTTPASKGIAISDLRTVITSGSAGVDEALASMNLLGWC